MSAKKIDNPYYNASKVDSSSQFVQEYSLVSEL